MFISGPASTMSTRLYAASDSKVRWQSSGKTVSLFDASSIFT